MCSICKYNGYPRCMRPEMHGFVGIDHAAGPDKSSVVTYDVDNMELIIGGRPVSEMTKLSIRGINGELDDL